jgi:hypothetical protein
MRTDPTPVNGGFVFVDKSKAKGYLLAAAVIEPRNLAKARREIRNLVLPRQQRILMTKESDSRRRQLLSVIDSLEVPVTIYRADSRKFTELACRDLCIDTLVRDAALNRHFEITFETDESLITRDQKQVAATMREIGLTDGLAYRHLRAASEPLLIIPDAVVWAWMKGGDWHRRVNLVTVIDVP